MQPDDQLPAPNDPQFDGVRSQLARAFIAHKADLGVAFADDAVILQRVNDICWLLLDSTRPPLAQGRIERFPAEGRDRLSGSAARGFPILGLAQQVRDSLHEVAASCDDRGRHGGLCSTGRVEHAASHYFDRPLATISVSLATSPGTLSASRAPATMARQSKMSFTGKPLSLA